MILRTITAYSLTTALLLGVSAFIYPRVPAQSYSPKTNEMQDLIDLELRLEEGMHFSGRTQIDQRAHFEYANAETKSAHEKLSFQLSYRVSSVDALGNSQLEVTLDAVDAEVEMPSGEVISYHSNRKRRYKPSPLLAPFAEMVGTSVTLTLDRHGKQISKNQSALAELVGLPLIAYPGTSIGIGSLWKGQQEYHTSSPRIVDSTWRLIGSDEGVATIETEGRIHPNRMVKNVSYEEYRMLPSISGSESGVLYVDEATGIVMGGEFQEETSRTLFNAETEKRIALRVQSTTTFQLER